MDVLDVPDRIHERLDHLGGVLLQRLQHQSSARWGRSHATGWGIHTPMPIPCSRSRVRHELADAFWLATVRCQPRTARRAGDHAGIAMREVAATPEQDG
jgi:hypothetical protein